MVRLARCLLLVPLMVVVLAATAVTTKPVAADDEGEKVYERLLRSTVWVVVPMPDKKKGTGVPFRSGTGSLIDLKRNLILTNYHVVGDYDAIHVFFPIYQNKQLVADRKAYLEALNSGQSLRGKVVVKEPGKDLAVIQLESVPPGAHTLTLAAKSAGPGQTVHSLGNPGASGALWAYTSGTVRTQPTEREFRSMSGDDVLMVKARMLETQNPTNKGDSGGPLVNDKGELVAVTQGGVADANQVALFIDVSEVKTLLAGKGIRPVVGKSPEKPDKVASETPEKPEPKPKPQEDPAEQNEKRAASRLKQARNFAELKQYADAREYCDEIVKKYPTTKAAAEAKELLEKMKGK